MSEAKKVLFTADAIKKVQFMPESEKVRFTL